MKERELAILALLSDSKVALYASIIAKNESLIVKNFEQCDIIDVLRIGERGILQKETDGKDTSVWASICEDG